MSGTKTETQKISSRWIVVMLIDVIVIAAGITGLLLVKVDHARSDEVYEDAVEQFVVETPGVSEDAGELVYTDEEDGEGEDADDGEAEINGKVEPADIYGKDVASRNDSPSVPWDQRIDVNFDGLKKVNPDIVGWIFFESETISYPILHGTDNNEYLRTTYTGLKATAGSIFIDAQSNVDFTDSHTIVYGHNMNNLSMFGKLKYYEKVNGYFDGHKYFQIITPTERYRYEVFAYREVLADDPIYTLYRDGGEQFGQFITDSILKDSLVNSSRTVDGGSSIVTLSTCSKGGKRFVVSGVMVDAASD